MTTLYVDAYAGASGDMLLGALLDLGVDIDELRIHLSSLPVMGWDLQQAPMERQGVCGSRALVTVDTQDQPHRYLADVRQIIEMSDLSDGVKAAAASVFERLAQAEARVHGTSVEEVHFHEVGALDSLLDVVGTCQALETLGVDKVYCSPLPMGSGFVRSAHGLLPVPAPATLELLSHTGAQLLMGRGEGEMVTPTAAALLAHFADFRPPPVMNAARAGYGFGSRETPWPNAVRLVLSEDHGLYDHGDVLLLECNLDDMSPEIFPFVIERLLAAGALDAWTTAINMKKGRPATKLSALTTGERADEVTDLLLRETTTLGVRCTSWHRYVARRELVEVETPAGSVRVKLKLRGDEVIAASPEYEDCARLARETGLPLREIYEQATRCAQGR